jgi:hypothetical protein
MGRQANVVVLSSAATVVLLNGLTRGAVIEVDAKMWPLLRSVRMQLNASSTRQSASEHVSEPFECQHLIDMRTFSLALLGS